MKFMLDTANLDSIKKYSNSLNILGVTTNPSIVAKEGKVDLIEHFKSIRNIISNNSILHIQILSEKADEIIEEAEFVRVNIDSDAYIKIPVTLEGLEAIKKLKNKGFKITATAVYSDMQGYLAIDAGADYIAPYYNRMQNLNIDSKKVVADLSEYIEMGNYKSKLVVASFKNVKQISEAFSVGAHSVTVPVDIIEEVFKAPSIDLAVENFAKDWKKVFGDAKLNFL